MATRNDMRGEARAPLTRERVLLTAVQLADDTGLDALSMRKLGHALGVEAMSLYNHVANKGDLLDGMADVVWSQIDLPTPGGEWRAAIRATAVSAHDVLVRHPWACGLAMSSERICPARLRYMDAILGRCRAAGFSDALTFHAYHAVDSHAIGFTMWEVGHTPSEGSIEELAARFLAQIAATYPHLAEHVEHHLAGVGSEGDGEFVFVLDLILDGLERHRAAGSLR